MNLIAITGKEKYIYPSFPFYIRIKVNKVLKGVSEEISDVGSYLVTESVRELKVKTFSKIYFVGCLDKIYINKGCICYNLKTDNLLIDNPGFYLFKYGNINKLDIKATDKLSLHIENLEIKNLNLKGDFLDTTIEFNNCIIDDAKIKDSQYNHALRFIDCKFIKPYIYNEKEIFASDEKTKTITGYISGNRYDGYPARRKALHKVRNHPQYLSDDLGPALMVGCEITAASSALEYILNKKISKNELKNYLKYDYNYENSFWHYFYGDIYKDGFGTMAPAIVDALNSYKLKNKEIYEAINYTCTPFYSVLKLVEKAPVIIWVTMRDKYHMRHKKFGSTIFKNGLYWPGNDHAVAIVGYDLDKGIVYLADPEENSEEIITRDIYEVENRFAEMYAQSIFIDKL